MKIKYINTIVACFLISSIFGFVWMAAIINKGDKDDYITLLSYCQDRNYSLNDYFIHYKVNHFFTNGFTVFNTIQVYHGYLYAEIIIGLIASVLLIIK